jgi:hypothetical protein
MERFLRGATTQRFFSVPVFEQLDPAELFALWNEIKHNLPRFHVVPWASLSIYTPVLPSTSPD